MMCTERRPRDPILVVDDEDLALQAIRGTLESEGYDNLVLCSDSRKARGLLQTESFSLVLLDLSMPYVSGKEIIRAAAEARYSSPPIVVIAGSRSLDDYADGVAGGIADYLVKPVERKVLVDTVRRVLARPAGGSRARLAKDYLLFDRIEETARRSGLGELLSQARSEYRRLLGELPIPYVVVEAGSLDLRFANRVFAAAVGLAGRTPAARSLLDIVDADSAARLRDRLLGGTALTGVELRGTRPDGQAFLLLGSFRADPGDGYLAGGLVDATERIGLEKELARASRAQAIGQLTAGLAHDFNNLLQVVAAFGQVILDEEDASAAVREAAQQICSAAERGGTLVRRLVGSQRPQPAERPRAGRIDLNTALAGLESGLRLLMADGQRLVTRLEATAAEVEVDPTSVEQVVNNLVLNARDAMPRGGTVTISTRDHGQDGILLEVADTGVGMNEETRARLFEPYFTTKPPGVGSGLGLPMTRSLVTEARGTLEVRSAPGAGATFSVRLPRAGG
jgi:signal transduction histidine kinase/CheY-like chemotaxis protein